MADHGIGKYTHEGCRCSVCRAASAKQRREHRARHREYYRAYDRKRKRLKRWAALGLTPTDRPFTVPRVN